MTNVLDSVFDVDRPRSYSEWRDLLEGLAQSLSALLLREVAIAGFHAETDDLAHASWGAAAYVRVLLSALPLLELSGAIMVTVNVREAVAISADLLLFAEGNRIRGPGDGDLFRCAFTADRKWVPCGWMTDDTGEWEMEKRLSPQIPSGI